ncbi:pickpocket protein 19-like [Anticarsia gemmatalis]|uniref:pickpocket protein 19-like n=1 Tax=Anticarsia gemmatalis TaxID=129554 RepID=UPI003F7752EB
MYTYYDYPVSREKRQVKKPGRIRRWLATLMEVGRDFCKDTSIHGFNHIAAPRRLWIERLLWVCACALATWGALDVSLGQLQRYNESPTVVTLEKDFRSWRFSLPAITCCYMNRMDPNKLPGVIKKYWNIDVHDEQYAYYTRFVNAVASSDLFHLNKFEEFKDLNNPVDMFQIAVDVMPEAAIKTMSSEGSNFKWWPVMTEGGACYVSNSLTLADVAIVKPKSNETAVTPITCKYSTLSCYIIMDVNTPADFYVHSPYDVADLTDPPSAVYLTITRTTELSIMETRCGRGVKDLAPTRRGCLYTDEPSDEGRRVYSTNTCRLSCRSRLALKKCGCLPFYYFYEAGPSCTPAGMWCLSRFSQQLASTDGEKCVCAPQCVDSVFKEISTNDQIWDKGPFMARGSVKFTVQAPRTRYTREIVFHFQDLVVSFGGAAGLFLGASFISFIEILYFLLARLFGKTRHKHEKTKLPVKVKLPTLAHETIRMKKLSDVLETQRKYERYDMAF